MSPIWNEPCELTKEKIFYSNKKLILFFISNFSYLYGNFFLFFNFVMQREWQLSITKSNQTWLYIYIYIHEHISSYYLHQTCFKHTTFMCKKYESMKKYFHMISITKFWEGKFVTMSCFFHIPHIQITCWYYHFQGWILHLNKNHYCYPTSINILSWDILTCDFVTSNAAK